VLTPGNAVVQELQDHFTFTDYGIISGLKENTAFAYLGDLTDRSANDIEITINMLRMKEASPVKVVLIGGNRDFNKVRMATDFEIVTADGQDIFSKDVLKGRDIIDLCKDISLSFTRDGNSAEIKYKFKKSIEEIQTYLSQFNNALWTPWVEKKDWKNDETGKPIKPKNQMPKKGDTTANTLNRAMFEKVQGGILETYGIQSTIVDYRKQELSKMLNNGSIINLEGVSGLPENKNFEKALFCVCCMVFGKEHDVATLETLFPDTILADDLHRYSVSNKNDLRKYLNGLHLQYIKQCHVIAHMKHGNKNIILTHAGMMDELTAPIMMNKRANKSPASLPTIIQEINREVRVMVDELSTTVTGNHFTTNQKGEIESQANLAHKFIFMTAPCSSMHGDISHKDAPVVSSPSGKVNELKELKYDLSGGFEVTWMTDEPGSTVLSAKNNEVENLQAIDYNIYGHAPK